MEGNTRAFPHVFALAQKSLHSAFGLELVELMSRAEREKEQNDTNGAVGEEMGTGVRKKGL